MKNVLKVFIAVLGLFAFSLSNTLRAQNGERIDEQQNALMEKLDLSQDQKVKFTRIQTKYASEISELRGQGKESRKQMKALKK